MLHRLEHLYADSGFHLGGFFWILRFFCLHHLARDDYFIGGFRLLDSIDFATLQQPCSSYSHNHHPHFHFHSHPQHPHHPPHHPHHLLRPHHRRHQLAPVTITFVIISFLHRSGQQPHQHQKVGTVCDLQQLQKTAWDRCRIPTSPC